MRRPLLAAALAVLAPLALGSCALFRVRPPEYDPFVTASGLRVQDVVVPETERTAREGERVTIHYEARVAGGEVFDSSYQHGAPATFVLGAGEVPPGLEEGIRGMRLKGRRVLTIPPALAYGEEGLPPHVPPGATVVIDLELLQIEDEGGAGDAADDDPAGRADDGDEDEE